MLGFNLQYHAPYAFTDRILWAPWQHLLCEVRSTALAYRAISGTSLSFYLSLFLSILGVITVQMVLYFRHFPHDGRLVKASVSDNLFLSFPILN